MDLSEYAVAIESHYSRVWSAPVRRRTWRAGPTDALPKDFRILVFGRPTGMAYATCCMSQPDDTDRLEVHLFAPDDRFEDGIVELLTAIAHFHRTGERLGLHHTVNFGRPWADESQCTYGLISLPYLDGPALEWLQSPKVRFLWLVPITRSEVAFKKSHGVDALEDLFERRNFDYLNPLRHAVI